jgi:hypothetical protein
MEDPRTCLDPGFGNRWPASLSQVSCAGAKER